LALRRRGAVQYPAAMKLLLDSFWRAAAYCLHPKVIGFSLLPLVLGTVITMGLGWFFWTDAVTAVRAALESWLLIDAALKWVEAVAGASFRSVIAPMIVVAVAAPVIVVLSVLLVAWLMSPAMVNLVEQRRFPGLARKQGGSGVGGVLWALGFTLVALLCLLLSMPLWFIPPLVLVLPPLIWGWLNYRVMSYDVLAQHASVDERRQLMREHRAPLLAIGVVSGYLGAAPSLLWAASAMTLVFAPVLVAVSVWLYTLVFAFSALWFTHYLLAALDALRRQAVAAAAPTGEIIDVTPSPAPLAPPTPPDAPHNGP